MNYTPKIYAKAFCDAVLKTKSHTDIDNCIKNLLALVKVNRDQKKLKDILLAVEKIISQKTSYRKLTIESARPLSETNEKIIKSLMGPTDRVEKKIDGQIIAGVKITINDELQFDGSFSTKIRNILNI